jgi:starch synthase (maltosyl-transferring)
MRKRSHAMKVKVQHSLSMVLESLKKKKAQAKKSIEYRVPALWRAPGEEIPENPREIITVDPCDYLIHHIEAILAMKGSADVYADYRGTKGFWIDNAIVYNIFPRLATAFDHNGDGTVGGESGDVTLNADGIRETGTFLKTIALLGHIHALRCTVVYFLPTTSIGRFGNKGDLGSPYAIRNPYELDERLADPLCDLDITTQFAALVEACHILGMKTILEFVFRTAAKDSDWIAEHPEWFYWIDNRIPERSQGMEQEQSKASYGNPIFTDEELKIIKQKVAEKDFASLPPPSPEYRSMFKLPPQSREQVSKNAEGQYIGISLDPNEKNEVHTRIPGAFADWPPDDVQPPWTDVTYLKLYLDEEPDNPRFNYIAYNTVRMYDTALARPSLANRPLWDKIRDIIPHYQKTFGINGIMVDMGHALPRALMSEIVEAARNNDPDFAFLSENFSIDRSSVDAGYNLVLGYSWDVEHKKGGLRGLLHHAGIEGMPLSFFSTSESHNTPRSVSKPGGILFSKCTYLINAFIPHGVPFIHNGFELGEAYPVNTGLGFSAEELDYLREKPLPLFDRSSFDWSGGGDLSSFIAAVNEIREKHRDLVAEKSTEAFAFLDTGNDHILGFKKMKGEQNLCVLVNLNLEKKQSFTVRTASPKEGKTENLLGNEAFTLSNGQLSGELKPGDGAIFMLK